MTGKPIVDFEKKIKHVLSNVSHFNIANIYDGWFLINMIVGTQYKYSFFGYDDPRLMYVSSYMNQRNESMKIFISGVTTTCDDPNVSLLINSMFIHLNLSCTVLIHLSGLHLSRRSLIRTVSVKKKIQKIFNIKHKHFCVIKIFKLSCCIKTSSDFTNSTI